MTNINVNDLTKEELIQLKETLIGKDIIKSLNEDKLRELDNADFDAETLKRLCKKPYPIAIDDESGELYATFEDGERYFLNNIDVDGISKTGEMISDVLPDPGFPIVMNNSPSYEKETRLPIRLVKAS